MTAPEALGSPPQAQTRRLLPSLAVVTLAVFANYAGLLAVLLPNQIEAIDPENKVTNLAIVTSVSFAFTIFAQPVTGALSDRTRSRLGRRAPWMLAGSVVAAAFLLGLGGLTSVAWICVFWVVIQFALNATDVASSAFLPDRVPRQRRGAAAAALGLGAMAGAGVGTVVAGPLADDHRSLAYTILGLGVVAVTALFVLVNRERSTAGDAVPAFRWRTFLRGFWIDPREHPGFAWVFGSRFLFVLGFNLIYVYQLYILTDYVGLVKDDANRLIGLLTVIAVGATIVGIVVGGWLSDRLARRRVLLVIACGILAAALAIPLVSATAAAVVAFAAIQGVASGLYISCGTALAVDLLPHRDTGAARELGIYNVATNIPQTVAPALAGVLVHVFDGYRPLFAVAIAAVVMSAVLVTRAEATR